VDSAAVLAAWGAMLLAECVLVQVLWPEQFSASWEYALARRLVVPTAVGMLVPAAPLLVVAWRTAHAAARRRPAARLALTLAGGIAAGAVAFGVSTGRHLAAAGVRAAFVLALAALGAAVARPVAVAAARAGRRPLALAALGIAIAAGGWTADAFVLPRLYPAFHVAMAVAALVGGGLLGLSFRSRAARASPVAKLVACVVGIGALACVAWSPRAMRDLDRASNVRIALVEHAPLLGRAVILASVLRPAEADTPSEAAAAAAPQLEAARALDWTGHDIVLVSIDALRADHVSAYGYRRPTTPSIDALAQEGTTFERAYCPTPHTSYSIASMMTGKYLRPLFALGLGQDSETWAEHLRRYEWRTAAFYPPAVFFIDQDRFPALESRHLGFEYAKVEFADPVLREAQVAEYLEHAPLGRPLFLWVHFFEPHEPYVAHANHVFAGGPSADVDAYDSEVATADEGVGRVVNLVRARRPGSVVIVTADHGEEFGEHGGRYHGTTVYEEQVRVPLVVVGPGVLKRARTASVVQTIDLLPTVLSALGIPRPARLRGRDLGPLLAGSARTEGDPGFAFAETDEYTLVASGRDRLVCQRRIAACALYRPDDDAAERRDFSRDEPGQLDRLRSTLRAVERDHGRYEAAGGAEWPEAIRRGMQGEVDSAADVASLLEDADVAIRRKAAEVCFALRSPATVPELRRSLGRDEDLDVRRWAALALVRLGDPIAPLVLAMTHGAGAGANPEWRRRAALVLAERGDDRVCDEIAAWWSAILPPPSQAKAEGEPGRLAMDLVHVEELLEATRKARCTSAVPALVNALEDVRARPYVADALGALGDARARAPLLAVFARETQVTTRPHEAHALLALGAPTKAWPPGTSAARGTVALPKGPVRLLALVSDPDASLEGSVDGKPCVPAGEGSVRLVELGPNHGPAARLELQVSAGDVVAVWVAPTGPVD
jgi:arylsulfatase A-like enzyme